MESFDYSQEHNGETMTGIDVSHIQMRVEQGFSSNDDDFEFVSTDANYTNEIFDCVAPETLTTQEKTWVFTIQLVIYRKRPMMRFRGKRHYPAYSMYKIKNAMSKMLNTMRAHSEKSRNLHNLVKQFLDDNSDTPMDVILSIDGFISKTMSGEADLVLLATSTKYQIPEPLIVDWVEDIKTETDMSSSNATEFLASPCSDEISSHIFSEETEKLMETQVISVIRLELHITQNGTIGVTCIKMQEDDNDMMVFPPVVAAWDAVSNIYAQEYVDLVSSRLTNFEKSTLIQTVLLNLKSMKVPMTRLRIRKEFAEKHPWAALEMGITRLDGRLGFIIQVEEVVTPMSWMAQSICECMVELYRNVSPIFTGVSA